MRVEDIASPIQAATPTDLRSDLRVQSSHPDVQELIDRFNANQEMDCPALDRGDLALIGAIYMEVVDDPDFYPTSHILALIRTLNAQMAQSNKTSRRN